MALSSRLPHRSAASPPPKAAQSRRAAIPPRRAATPPPPAASADQPALQSPRRGLAQPCGAPRIDAAVILWAARHSYYGDRADTLSREVWKDALSSHPPPLFIR